jgi:hypothetical protein
MSDARTDIESLLKKLKPFLLIAGVPKDQIHMRSGSHKIDTCVKAFDWLHKVCISEEYHNLKYVWNLLPAEIWSRYERLEVTDTREQGMLADAKIRLIKLWRDGRPRLFGKDRPTDNTIVDDATYESCRP